MPRESALASLETINNEDYLRIVTADGRSRRVPVSALEKSPELEALTEALRALDARTLIEYTQLSGDVEALDNRVDNIISGVTVDTEVIDARTGHDGTVYTVLKEALDAQFEELEDEINSKTGLSDDAKEALLACFQHVAWTDEHGQDYYDALEEALHSKELASISAVFDAQGTTIYADEPLNDLKQYLTVTAHYDDSTTAIVTDYTLSGTISTGTNTITVSYNGKTTTFNVTAVGLVSISAVFDAQGTTIYTDDSLDSLKQYLTVTANYSDSSTVVVTDYTLSGSLTEGTSTITVSYSEKTTTFNVTVAEEEDILYRLQSPVVLNGTSDYIDTDLQLMKTRQSFTIVVDFEDNNSPLANEEYATLFHCMLEDNTNFVYPGVSCHFTGIADRPNYKLLQSSYNYNTTSSSSFKSVWFDLANGSLGHIRMACSVNVDTNEMVCYLKVNNQSLSKTTTGISFASVNETLLIGAYRTQADVKGRFFKGTINEFKVYDYAFTSSECAAYIRGGQ